MNVVVQWLVFLAGLVMVVGVVSAGVLFATTSRDVHATRLGWMLAIAAGVAVVSVAVNATVASADVPALNGGEQPPGFEHVMQVVRWVFYGVGAAGVLGMLLSGATMMLQHKRGGMSDGAAGLGWVFAGCLVAAMSTGVVNAIL